MTGLLARLAARGSPGGQRPGDVAPMSAPMQPRFTGMGIEEATGVVPEVEPGNSVPQEQTLHQPRHDQRPTPEDALSQAPPTAIPLRAETEVSAQGITETLPQAEMNSSATESVLTPSKRQAAPENTPHVPPLGKIPAPAGELTTPPVMANEDRPDSVPVVAETKIETTRVTSNLTSAEARVQKATEEQVSMTPSPMPQAPIEPVVFQPQTAPVELPTTLSIGRIDVVFEQPSVPTPPPARPQRPTPNRTRGFDAYSDRRIGRRR